MTNNEYIDSKDQARWLNANFSANENGAHPYKCLFRIVLGYFSPKISDNGGSSLARVIYSAIAAVSLEMLTVQRTFTTTLTSTCRSPKIDHKAELDCTFSVGLDSASWSSHQSVHSLNTNLCLQLRYATFF